jgi:hypothetical protein
MDAKQIQKLREAFFDTFHESGEQWFPYGEGYESGEKEAITEQYFSEFMDNLNKRMAE